MARFAATACIAALSAWMATALAARHALGSTRSLRPSTSPIRFRPASAGLALAIQAEPARQVAAGRFPGRPESLGPGAGRMLDGTVGSKVRPVSAAHQR
jgi:hypothetical protein